MNKIRNEAKKIIMDKWGVNQKQLTKISWAESGFGREVGEMEKRLKKIIKENR